MLSRGYHVVSSFGDGIDIDLDQAVEIHIVSDGDRFDIALDGQGFVSRYIVAPNVTVRSAVIQTRPRADLDAHALAGEDARFDQPSQASVIVDAVV